MLCQDVTKFPGYTENMRYANRALGGTGSSDARIQRQQKWLDHYRRSRSIEEACKLTGVQRTTYERWRQRNPEFRQEVDGIRGKHLSATDVPWQGDFQSFRKRYFGYNTYWHQREIIHAIETAKPQEVVLVLCAPETGKSSVLTDYMCFRLGLDPNVRITLVSEGQDLARKMLRHVAKRMTDPFQGKEYQQRFGPFYIPGQERKGKPWGADYLTVAKSNHDEKDFSIEARGWRSAIAGTRTDLLLVDDIQSTRSLSQTEKQIETFRQDFLSRPGKDGKIVIVGTRVGQLDFYETLMDEGVVDRTVMLPAIRKPKGDEVGEDFILYKSGGVQQNLGPHVALCPEMWPIPALSKKTKNVGESAWWRNYMQRPQASIEATFGEAVLNDAKNVARRVGEPIKDEVARVAGLDPALAGGNAISVWSYNADKFALLDRECRRGLARYEQILERIDWFAARYHFDLLVVETVAFQRGLADDDRLRALARQYGFRVREHITGRNKVDEMIGVSRMATSFSEGSIDLPWADEATQEIVEPLVRQLNAWRPDIPTKKLPQDDVMAMWFAWLAWQEQRGRIGHAGRSFVRKGLPWKPSVYKRPKVAFA